MKKTKKEKLDAGVVRKLAVQADVDPRTIVRVYESGEAKTISSRRALEALKKAGHLS